MLLSAAPCPELSLTVSAWFGNKHMPPSASYSALNPANDRPVHPIPPSSGELCLEVPLPAASQWHDCAQIAERQSGVQRLTSENTGSVCNTPGSICSFIHILRARRPAIPAPAPMPYKPSPPRCSLSEVQVEQEGLRQGLA